MNPQLRNLPESNLEWQQAALGQEGRLARAFESYADPSFEILCPLAFDPTFIGE